MKYLFQQITIVPARLHIDDMRELISRALIVETDRIRHPTCRDRVSRGNTTVRGAANAATYLLERRRMNDNAATLRKHNSTRYVHTPRSKQTSAERYRIYYVGLKYSAHNKINTRKTRYFL